MNAFQKQTKDAADGMLRLFGLRSEWTEVTCRGSPEVGIQPGDVYLRGAFELADREYTAFIYPDEAGVSIDESWFICELPGYRNDTARLAIAYVEFLRLCLEGADPSVALRQASAGVEAAS